MRQWNFVATLTAVLVVVYVSVVCGAFYVNRIDFKTFVDAMAVVLLPVLGYLARMLNEQ